jgi:[ribosomal protein S5]-alanine N-acetyltransferase
VATLNWNKAMSFPVQLQTTRLVLRPPTEADAEAVFSRYAQDPVVSRFLTWEPHTSVESVRAYLERITHDNREGRSAGYLVFARDGDQLLGSIGGAINDSRMQFGYCLARDAWGRGFATEAARAFVAAVLAQPSVWRIQAHCDLENPASARVLEKAGLVLEGTLRRYMRLPNLGEAPRDLWLYAKVRSAET